MQNAESTPPYYGVLPLRRGINEISHVFLYTITRCRKCDILEIRTRESFHSLCTQPVSIKCKNARCFLVTGDEHAHINVPSYVTLVYGRVLLAVKSGAAERGNGNLNINISFFFPGLSDKDLVPGVDERLDVLILVCLGRYLVC